MAYISKRKSKKIITVILLCSVIIFAGFTYYYQQSESKDAEQGDIHNVKIENGEILNADAEPTSGGPKMKCIVFDVNDALSVLIDKGDTEILYDCGYEETSDKVVSKASEYIDGELEYLICSHSHADHVGGVPAVCKAFDVGTVITSGEKTGSSEQYDSAVKAIKKEKAEVLEDDNMQFVLGDGAKLTIIDRLDPKDTDEPNDLSVVAHISYGDQSILLTGDCEKEGERALLGQVGEVTLFIAGHHFSSTSNSQALLMELSPEYIVGSYGKSSEYGFPHKEAITRCLAVTSSVYSTAKSGTIVFTIDPAEDTGTISASEEDAITLSDGN